MMILHILEVPMTTDLFPCAGTWFGFSLGNPRPFMVVFFSKATWRENGDVRMSGVQKSPVAALFA